MILAFNACFVGAKDNKWFKAISVGFLLLFTACVNHLFAQEFSQGYSEDPTIEASLTANGTTFKYNLKRFTDPGHQISPTAYSIRLDTNQFPQVFYAGLKGSYTDSFSASTTSSDYGLMGTQKVGGTVDRNPQNHNAYDWSTYYNYDSSKLPNQHWYTGSNDFASTILPDENRTRLTLRPSITYRKGITYLPSGAGPLAGYYPTIAYLNSNDSSPSTPYNPDYNATDLIKIIIVKYYKTLLRHSYDSIEGSYWKSTSALGNAPIDPNSLVPRDPSASQSPSGIAGWACGFDVDSDPNTAGDNSNLPGAEISKSHMMSIYVPGDRFELTLTYPQSDPRALQANGFTPGPSPKQIFKLPGGKMRLWTSSGARKKASVIDSGNFVPSGTYTQATLPFSTIPNTDGRWVHLFIEGIQSGDATISVAVKSYWTDNQQLEQMVQTEDTQTIEISKRPGPCSCGVEGQYEDSSSVIDNNTLTYRHEADDFAYPQGGSSCGSCGGSALGSSGGTSRPSLRLHRIHRYDLQDWPSSMGPGVFLGYDLRLRELKPSGAWQLWDPSHHQVVSLSLLADNRLHDQGQGSLRDVTFYNASGTVLPPTGVGVVRAVLTEFDGQTVEFELIPAPTADAGVNRYARPTRFADSRGQAVTIGYVYPRDTSDATLGNDRAKLWQFTSITDGYGLSAVATYGIALAGKYPLVSLKVGAGTPITYDYATTGALIGLSAVHQRDGSVTSISAAPGATSDVIDLTFNDPMADGMHQQKIVTLTAPIAGGPLPWRVRMVRKANGEVIYRALATGDGEGNNVTLVQDGERIYRYVTNGGIPVRTDYLKSGTFDTAMATGVWETAHSFALDSMNRVTGSVDGLGQSTTTVRDPVTGYPTKITYADNTYEEFTYDAVGNRKTHRDRLQRQTDWLYDSFRNRTSEKHADGSIRTWSYDPTTGQLLTETDERGNVRSYSYNAKGQLERIEEPADIAGGVRPAITFGYDAFNRLSWSKDQRDREVQYFYDARNRPFKTLYADASFELTTFGTGADSGRVVRKTDRNGNITDFTYDNVGRRIASTQYPANISGVIEPVVEIIGKRSAA